MDITPEVAEAIRLTINLSVAGTLLLAMEVFFANRIFGIFGGFSLLVALWMAVKGYGFVVALLFLLGYVTVISLGFLIVISCFPKLPLAKNFLRRTRERVEQEEAAEQAEKERAEADDAGKEAPGA